MHHHLRPGRILLVLALVLSLLSAGSARALPESPAGPIRYIYVIPVSHLDIGFNVSVPDLIPMQKAFLDDAMDYAEQYPDYHWTVESIWQLDQWAAQTQDPSQVARMRRLIDSGKIEVTAGYANMHQGSMASEELNRFLYPARRYEERWGLKLATAMSNDVPGSSWALPQVLAANGVTNLVAGINTTFGGRPNIPPRDYLFNWQGVDGSKVLTWVSIHGYAEGIFSYLLPGAYEDMEYRTRTIVEAYQNNGYAYDAIMAMIGFDNEDPARVLDALANIERWNQEHEWPQIIISTPGEFFDHVRAVHGNDAFTTYQGDWSGLWENNDPRVPVSVADNRWVKNHLPHAETLSAVASTLDPGRHYPGAAFDRLYRNLLVWDEHSGPGEGFQLSEEEINQTNQWFRQRTESSQAATRALLRGGLTRLAGNIAAPRPALVVYNPLSWERTDIVSVPLARLDGLLQEAGVKGHWRLVDLETREVVATQTATDGNGVMFRATRVPPVGYRLYGVIPAPSASNRPASTQSNQIDNQWYRVIVDPITGDIASIFDKLNGRELVDSSSTRRFNSLIRADQSNSFVWGTVDEVPTGPVQVAAETGPVYSQLLIDRAASPLSRTVIRLYAGLPRVEITNVLEHERTEYATRDVFTYWYDVAMPFALGQGGFTGHFQGPNGWLVPQRDWIPGTRHNSRTPRHATDIRASDGFGVIVANRESYLARFGSFPFWNNSAPAAPVLYNTLFARTDEAETSDQGWIPFESWEPGAPRIYTFNFALMSTAAGFDPVSATRFGAAHSTPLLLAGIARNTAGPLPAPTGSLISTSHAHVEVHTLKRADFENPDGTDLILRLQEIAGRPASSVTITLPFQLEWAEINGMGEQRAGATQLTTAPLQVDLAPFQTLTVRLRPAR
jgi:hypothetical protein